MNAHAKADQIPTVTPRQIFELRAWARARLYAEGLLDLHEAIDVLQEVAECNGLVSEIGPDAVQRILAENFGAVT